MIFPLVILNSLFFYLQNKNYPFDFQTAKMGKMVEFIHQELLYQL